ncbi:MAG: YgaP-like transmembrane domain [Alphaproteobacteria bacterium]
MKEKDPTLSVIGGIILAGIIWAELIHPDWIILSTFAAVMLVVAGLTGCCPLRILLRKCGRSDDDDL